MARKRLLRLIAFVILLLAASVVLTLAAARQHPPAKPLALPTTTGPPSTTSTTIARPTTLLATTTAPKPSPSPPPSPVRVVPPPGSPGSLDEPAAFVQELPAGAIEIAAGGDVNLGGTIGKLITSSGPNFPWRRVAPLLHRADIAIFNLECTVSTLGNPQVKEYTFQGDPASLPAMKQAGVGIVTQANNHALDFGPEALLDTKANIEAAGIRVIGSGSTVDAAFQPAVVEAKGKRIAFISATRVLPPGWAATSTSPGVASAYAQKRLIQDVRRARATSDIVVVAVHWGVERSVDPDPSQVDLAHALVDAGAGIVLGAHPHVLQPVVRYRGAVIAYSLGNFVFTAPSLLQDSMLLRVGIMPDNSLTVAKVPILISGGQPRPV